jgi:hypothetical protein
MAGPGGAPQPYVPVSAGRAAAIRATCARTGRALVALSLVLAAAAVVLALVRRSDGFVAGIMLSAGVTGAGLAAMSGTVLLSAPSYLHGEHLNEARARTARRVELLLWIASIVVAGLFYVALIALARGSGLALGPAAVALFVLPAAPCALTGVGHFTAHRLVRPG